MARNDHGGNWGYHSFRVNGLILGELDINFWFGGIVLRRFWVGSEVTRFVTRKGGLNCDLLKFWLQAMINTNNLTQKTVRTF